jgi:hypothetical protein
MADPIVIITVLTVLARIVSKVVWARGVAAVVRAAGPGAAVVCKHTDGTELSVLPGGQR